MSSESITFAVPSLVTTPTSVSSTPKNQTVARKEPPEPVAPKVEQAEAKSVSVQKAPVQPSISFVIDKESGDPVIRVQDSPRVKCSGKSLPKRPASWRRRWIRSSE